MKRLFLTAAIVFAAMTASAQTTVEGAPFCVTRELIEMAETAVASGDRSTLQQLLNAGVCGQMRGGLPFTILDAGGQYVQIRIHSPARDRFVDVWVFRSALGTPG